ncbi:hypothetical protein [Paludibacterium denitrificans]|uniref:hypothetical protein n=1 Tax=Paludibacterium denitrificans TaxID=2675226 RepID=UPI001E3888DE|nr:hypothetical protein [Paludibacterium denitrificans]
MQIVGAGSYALLLDPLPSAAIGVRGVRSNLVVGYTGTSGVVSVTATELSLESAFGSYITLKNLNLSATSGNASGAANSLDTGSWAYSTWYYLFVIYNPTTSTSALLWSLSATSPTLPSGYTYFSMVSVNKTQSATNYWFLGGTQTDRVFQPKVNGSSNVLGLPLIASGAAGSISTPTWVAIGLGSAVPPNTCRVALLPLVSTSPATIIAAPNNSYGVANSTSNPPPLFFQNVTSGGVSSYPVWMTLESTSVYWASSAAGCYLFLSAWELNL